MANGSGIVNDNGNSMVCAAVVGADRPQEGLPVRCGEVNDRQLYRQAGSHVPATGPLTVTDPLQREFYTCLSITFRSLTVYEDDKPCLIYCTN
jgi:hypothetical protein